MVRWIRRHPIVALGICLPLLAGCISQTQGQDYFFTEVARLTGTAVAYFFQYFAQAVNPIGNTGN